MLIKLVVKIYLLNLVSAYWGYTLIVFMTQGYFMEKKLRTAVLIIPKLLERFFQKFHQLLNE